jgi:hypothetical protein
MSFRDDPHPCRLSLESLRLSHDSCISTWAPLKTSLNTCVGSSSFQPGCFSSVDSGLLATTYKSLSKLTLWNMLGTSAAEYAFIRVCTSVLHCVAPLSVLYCVVITIDSATLFRMRPEIELWLIAEALFWTCFYFPYRWYLQHAATHPPPRSKEERRKLVDCVKAELTDPEQYIRGWIKGAEAENIRRKGVKEWLTWAFFDRDCEERRDEDEIEGYTLEIERMLRKDSRPGNGTAKSLRLTIDPVDMLHRSLLWYLVGIFSVGRSVFLLT